MYSLVSTQAGGSSMMRFSLLAGCALLLATSYLPAAETEDPHAGPSRVLQEAIAARAPKEVEDRSEDWGKTIPVPARLRLPRLRTYVQVGDQYQLPHGAWVRTFFRSGDPKKSIRVRVRELQLVEAGKARLQLDVTVATSVEREHQQWQKGLLLFQVTSEADMVVVAKLSCQASFGLNTSKLPPRLEVKAEVTDVRLDLKDFQLRRIIPFVGEEKARAIGEEIKVVVAGLVRAYEGDVKEQANAAIAEAMKDGKVPLSAASLLQAAPAVKPGK